MKWAVRIVQGLLAVGFLMSGPAKLFSTADQLREMYTETLGYGAGFMYAVGAAETLAALALIAGFWQRLIAMGASGLLAAIMIGAIVSNLSAGLAADIALPLIYFILLLFLILKLSGRIGASHSAAGISER